MRRESEVRGKARVLVEEIGDRPAFIALEREWNALVAETDDQIFYRHEFFRVWLDNFAPGGKLKVLLLRGPGGRLEAALPLYELREPWYGVPVRQLCSAANVHSCRFDLIARDPVSASDALIAWIAADRSWDVLRLTDVPEGGKGFELLAAAKRYGLPTGAWESLRSPFIPLPKSPAQAEERLDAKFKANLRRRRKKLESKGAIAMERFDRGRGLERSLEEGFALERSGWKGSAGTAIAQDGPTRGFYTELARMASGMGTLALNFMRLDGRAVGFHYALEYGGRYLLLKPAYDEALRECSPGQLMMEEVQRACIERGLSEFDFLGPDMVWKRDWTDQLRPHFYLYIFRRSLLGRTLAGTRFRLIPAVKERVRRWKR